MRSNCLRPCGLILLLLLVLFAPDPAAAGSGVHVYLMRGIFDVSVGLDALAAKLSRLGFVTTVYSHTESDELASQAISDYRSGRARHIILIGHSLGGGAVLSAADSLNTAGVPVALLIALDSTSMGPVAPNVRRAVGFYIPGTGSPLAAAPGFRGSLQNIDVGSIPGMDHMGVQSLPAMHSRMIGLVGAARGG